MVCDQWFSYIFFLSSGRMGVGLYRSIAQIVTRADWKAQAFPVTSAQRVVPKLSVLKADGGVRLGREYSPPLRVTGNCTFHKLKNLYLSEIKKCFEQNLNT